MINPKCPYCGSPSRKSGIKHLKYGDVQVYFCSKCKKVFQLEHYEKKQKKKPKQIKKIKKEKPKLIIKKPLNIDSIVDVPCFCCFKNPCNPITCERLTEWLEHAI